MHLGITPTVGICASAGIGSKTMVTAAMAAMMISIVDVVFEFMVVASYSSGLLVFDYCV